jgi:FMNH2-dependent dimethyl sulfone monooxygenase
MQLGIWCPAPQTIRPDAETKESFAALSRHGGGVDESFLYAVSILQRAEELGFDISLIAQRYLGPDLDSWVLASALAPVTRRIKIMAALHPGIADPRVAAKMAVSLDRISGGRFCINIVNGLRKDEFDSYGHWLDQTGPRYRRMDEFISVMKGLWTEEGFDFNGAYYTVKHGSLPTKSVQAGHPPLYAASRVDDGMEIVARDCDAWFVNYEKDRRLYEQSLLRIECEMNVMAQKRRRHGRSRITYGINALVIIAATDAEADALAEEHLQAVQTDKSIHVGTSGLGANLIGSPKTVIERFRRYQSMGIDLFMLFFHPMRDGLETFAREVLPELRRG